MNIRTKLVEHARKVYHGGLVDEKQQAVLNFIMRAEKPVHQREIALRVHNLGPHPQHEKRKKKQRSIESTERMVRGIINKLRTDHLVAICADDDGYWIPETLAEVEANLDLMEGKARSAAASYMRTIAAMQKAVTGLRDRPVLFDTSMWEDKPDADRPDARS